jgi:hypothetical protein
VFDGVQMVVNSRQVVFIHSFFILLFNNLFLGGEDGQIRIWARSGMLRSNLVQSGKS